ncbi:hypothetical protein [Nonomuraea typhae]|uniref:CBM-cenC domain-containing protein n=1 Tax=Nonomuraea typhae TaxID=2603600 RepID=A0ABW7YJ44_9ACTN
MALYANFVPNPSFELGVTNWDGYESGSRSRVGSNAAYGSYSMRIQHNGSRNIFGGVHTVVPITPAVGQPYTLSLNISGATEEHGASNNAGTRITIYDVLTGQSTWQQRAQQTFSRTTNGRVAIRNVTPRATADRIVIVIETASTYFRAQQTSTLTSGLVWATFGVGGSGGITNPAGTNISSAEWSSYSSQGYTLSGGSSFTYRNTFEQLSYNAQSGTWNKTVVTAPEINGGLTTVYVDAVKLEQGTVESAYVDGTTPGYVWSGAPHNSATLNIVPLEASGSGSLTNPSPAEVRPIAFLEGSGSLGLSGTAEITAEGTVSASGASDLTGAAEFWRSGAMGAGGQGSLVGVAEVYAIVPIEAHGTLGPGTGIHEPRASMDVALPMGADGWAGLTGSVELSFPQPISASGSSSLSGTAQIGIGLQLVASGSSSLSGTAALDDAVPKGAFADFAIYSVAATDSDPLMLGRGASNAGTSSGANGQPWTRIHAEFMAPSDQPSSSGYAWRRAAYAAVGFRFNAVPAGNYQELSCVQLEASTTDSSTGPRTYSTARTVRPLVHADRVNYAIPEIWTFFGSTGISVTESGTSPIPHDAKPIRELKILSSGASGFFGANMVIPVPGTWCVLSIYLKGSPEVSQVEVKVLGNDFSTVGSSGQVFLPAGQWTRVAVPFIASDQDHMLAINIPFVTSYPATIYASGYQVERGTAPTEYLGFVAGSTDYYYRYNGSDPNLGVYYYRDLAERIPLVVDAVEEHLPLSMRASDPAFGLVPHLD